MKYVQHHQPKGPKVKSVESRFWAKVDRSGGENACWIWTGAKTDSGYGAFNTKTTGKWLRVAAHRFSYQLAHGDYPLDLCVLHNCPEGDNPACCNPKHLFLGTQIDNLKDMKSKNRHAKGESNGKSKLTSIQVKEIRNQYANGQKSQSQLAKEFGIAQHSISRIVRNKGWVDTNEMLAHGRSNAETTEMPAVDFGEAS